MTTELESQLEMAESLAQRHADGHLTIMRFTTGWKVMLGTPSLDDGSGRDQVSALPSSPTLVEALRLFLKPHLISQ